jgi:hypothetical protein
MSDTPRVDSIAEHHYTDRGLRSASVVQACFARELERDLARATAERDEAWLTNATLRADVARANAERDEARRELCEMKASQEQMRATDGANHNPRHLTAAGYAADRGWNCFDAKEGKP